MSDHLTRLKAALEGRYAIDREVGAGGMALVYLAEDVKHKRQVAVKVLRPELAAALGAERFIQEIEVAAQLAHPHILPLYDSGEADGFLFYVMPYVEGQSLRQHLQSKGELPVAEAVRIIREVVDALGYAHRRGVVHRDIKPDNVMLSERHALVTDFGVAKAVSEATGRQQLTTAGVALGTPAYMAPEQATADPNIDHRADLYAVGAMAYELLTGEPPFSGGTAQAVLSAHMTKPPKPVTEERPAIPEALGSVVMRCLEKRPADRWQTAEEMLPHLETAATPSGGMTPVDTRPIQAMPQRSKAIPIGVGLGLVGALAVVGTVLLRPGGPELDDNRVLVAPLTNETGDPSYDAVGKIAADMVARGLQETRLVEIVDPATATRLTAATSAGDATDATAAAVGAGAGTLVSGSYFLLGDSLRIQAQVIESSSGTVLNALDPVTASAQSPMDGLDAFNQRVMAAVASLFSAEMVDLSRIVTLPTSYDAYREHIAGQELAYQNDWEAALPHFERAMALDSTFAITAVWAAQSNIVMGRYAGADTLVRVLDRFRNRLTEGERQAIDYQRHLIAGDNLEAYRAMRRMRDLAQGRSVTAWTLAVIALDVGRSAEALDVLNALDPDTPLFESNTWLVREKTYNHHVLGAHDTELDVARTARQRDPDRQTLAQYEAVALAALGRVAELRTLLDESAALPEDPDGFTPGATLTVAALELMAHGHTDVAAEVLDRAIAWFESHGNIPAYASTLYVARRWDDARALYTDLAAQAPDNMNFAAVLGLIAAHQGDVEEARRVDAYLADQASRPYIRGAHTLWRARLAAALGDREQAVTHLRTAFNEGQHYGITYHRDPDLQLLAGYAPFEELMRPRG